MGGKNCAENIFDILWVNNSNNQYIQGDGLLVYQRSLDAYIPLIHRRKKNYRVYKWVPANLKRGINSHPRGSRNNILDASCCYRKMGHWRPDANYWVKLFFINSLSWLYFLFPFVLFLGDSMDSSYSGCSEYSVSCSEFQYYYFPNLYLCLYHVGRRYLKSRYIKLMKCLYM